MPKFSWWMLTVFIVAVFLVIGTELLGFSVEQATLDMILGLAIFLVAKQLEDAHGKRP